MGLEIGPQILDMWISYKEKEYSHIIPLRLPLYTLVWIHGNPEP